jgi:DNA-directed RNA polymerase subunit K/omega
LSRARREPFRARRPGRGAHASDHEGRAGARDSKNRPAVTALREIAAGHVHWNRRSQEAVNEFIEERKRNDR